jgi:heme/copper-type cytochrome/quinol oxidase subunit 3
MSIDTDKFGKGIKQLLVLILLLIVSPITLNIAFKALNKMEDSMWIAYLILTIAIILSLTTIVLAFKTIKTFLDGLFNK